MSVICIDDVVHEVIGHYTECGIYVHAHADAFVTDDASSTCIACLAVLIAGTCSKCDGNFGIVHECPYVMSALGPSLQRCRCCMECRTTFCEVRPK